jgi:hypothetical protein
VAIAAKNGDDGISPAQQILALEGAFQDRGLSFRYFPRSTVPELKWQAGREVVDAVTMPDGSVLQVGRFELCAWAATPDALGRELQR